MSIIYLDTSALLKLYIQEKQSEEMSTLLERSEGAATSILTYTETAAALARAVRMQMVSQADAKSTWNNFLRDWPGYTRLKVSTRLTERAALLAWDFGLRGYDAMHLAAALTWQETLETPICLATFDRLLWEVGRKTGLAVWPEELPNV